jgi:glutaminase
MDYQKILEDISDQLDQMAPYGKVARYIPELAKVDPDKFGVHLNALDGSNFSVGNSDEKFSLQSIAKVLSLALALEIEGRKLWKWVDVEPSGDPFNSLVQLEHEEGKPRNPFINAGALVICDILVSRLKDPKREFLEFVRRLAENDDIHYNESVASSEKRHGHRNAALLSFMKSFGNIQNDNETVLDFYFHMCSIEMTCQELAHTFMMFANDGKSISGKRFITEVNSKRINAIMLTCGFYDQAGEFSFTVGLPGKSGVGGGIVAVEPDELSIAVWSPRLNKKGNSYKGMKMLELFTTKTGFSIF